MSSTPMPYQAVPLAVPTLGRPGARVLLTFATFLALYTFIPINIGTLVIPAPFLILFGSMLLILNSDRLNMERVSAVGLVIGFFVASAALSPLFLSDLKQRALVVGMHIYSIVGCLGIYLELSRWTDDLRRAFVRFLLAFILIGTFLEISTPLGAISDSFRIFAYGDRADTDVVRDMIAMGGVRPKFFVSEPSYLGVMAALLIYLNAVVSRSATERFIYLALSLVAFLLIRSPIVFVAPVMALVQYVFRNGLNPRRFIAVPIIAVVVILAWSALSDFAVSLLIKFFPRIVGLMSGSDGSFITRFVMPLELLIKVISAYPLFGTGAGGSSVAIPMIQTTNSFLFNPRYYLSVGPDMAKLIGSAVFLIPIYFGILGTGIFYWVTARMCRVFSPRVVAASVLGPHLIIMAFCGFSVLFWGYLFLMLAYAIPRPLRTAPTPMPASRDGD